MKVMSRKFGRLGVIINGRNIMNRISFMLFISKFPFWSLFCLVVLDPGLNAQETTSAYTQPCFQKYIQMVAPDQSIIYSFWLDQTDSCSITLSCIAKNLSIQVKDPNGNTFVFGQSENTAFQTTLYPDPMAFPEAPGANYYMTLSTPVVGQWTLLVSAPTVPTPVLTLPVRIAFNNQVGPVLLGGGGSGSIGNPLPFSLAVIDGTAKVSNLQIEATLLRLDDPTVPPAPITFADDGQGADYAAGDSIYSVYLTPSQPGQYMVQVEVSGDASTGHFQRSIASGFKIVRKTARIVGTFKERAVPALPH